MPDTHLTEEDLILQYYGERANDARISDHLANCAHCTSALQELSDVLALVETERVPEPLAGLEARVWARLQPEIAHKRTSWLSRLVDGTPRWAFAGGVVALVAVAFIAGRFTRTDVAPGVTPAAPVTEQVAAASPDNTGKLMTVAVGEHLDQSQMVLMELLNGDVQHAANIEDEQVRARDLVAANRLFRQIAVRAGDEGVREVLDALERVLIEIANAPPDVSARELAALRSDIEQRGILFRVRVVASEMRAREEKDVMASPVAEP